MMETQAVKSSKKRVLIAGCGRIGTQFGRALIRTGHSVWGLRRTTAALPGKMIPLRADLATGTGLSSLPSPLDFVFYTVSSDSPQEKDYRAAYSLGVQNLISALQDQKLARLVFVSSTGVYAQQAGEWVDEDSPAEPTHASARYLLEAETRVKNSPFPSAVVRFGGIYGPGRIRLLKRISIGKEAYPQDRTQYTNLIHLDDCVGILSHLMGLCNTAPLYVAVDMEPVDRRILLHWLADRLHAPKPHMLPSSSLPSRQLRSNKRCSNRRLIDSGYRFRFPTFREGYEDLIEDFNRQSERDINPSIGSHEALRGKEQI